MAQQTEKRGGNGFLLASVALLLIFGGLIVHRLLIDRDHFQANAALLEEAGKGTIVEDEATSLKDSSWPQFRGPHRDGVAGPQRLLKEWPKDGPPVAWRHPAGDGYSSFAVANGLVYTMMREDGKESTVCWKLDDGKEMWRESYDCPLGTFEQSTNGPRSTPTVHEGRLYTVGAGGHFQCRQADTGKLLWEHSLLKEYNAPNLKWGVSFSPLVDGGLVFTNPGGPNGNSVVAFDAKTGKEVWKKLDDPASYSSPIAIDVGGEHQVVFFTGNAVVGLTARDGQERWRHEWITQFGVNAATPIAFQITKGQEIQNYLFISSGYNTGCALLQLATKEGGAFEAKKVYDTRRMCNHFTTSVRCGEYVYGFNEGRLCCMNIRTGQVSEAWNKGDFHKGNLVRVGADLIVLGEKGQLALVEANPAQFVEKARAHPMKEKTWPMPALADGRLLLRGETEVICLDLRAK
jgi:outer membrane protein assembly factor BamB